MKADEFTAGTPGRLVKIARDCSAYAPGPLPPPLSWTGEVVSLLSAATLALGRLDGVGRTLANPHLLIRPFLRREAVLSSRIEGTVASLSDLFFFEAAPTAEPEVRDVREVANYVRALEYGLRRRFEVPMGLGLIKEMHALLMEGVRGKDQKPGEFRRIQNWIGPHGCEMRDAIFVPPPPMLVLDALESLETFIQAPSGLPPLVRLAIIHYQFEAIHPFADGNGRLGRLLVTLLLCMESVLAQPLLYLSAYLERNRQEYYHRLLRVSQAGEWGEWIAFFLRGVAEQAMDAVERAERLRKLRESLRERFHEARTSGLLLKLVDELFSTPVITTKLVAATLDVTFRSARHYVNLLVAAGLLREATGFKRNRAYVADTILEVLDDPNLTSH